MKEAETFQGDCKQLQSLMKRYCELAGVNVSVLPNDTIFFDTANNTTLILFAEAHYDRNGLEYYGIISYRDIRCEDKCICKENVQHFYEKLCKRVAELEQERMSDGDAGNTCH